MKSDREFLSGVYAKAEVLTESSGSDNEYMAKKKDQRSLKIQNVISVRHMKYAGMAAGFLLMISSAIYFNSFKGEKSQEDNTPAPISIRMPDYAEQLMQQATDIIAVEANDKNNDIIFNKTKSYKNSLDELVILNYLDNEVIGLTAGQSAVVFIKADSKDNPIIGIFLWDVGNNIYTNSYGDTITLEQLNNLN